MADNSLRGMVITVWEEAGKPAWDSEKTVTACGKCDEELQKQGVNKAPAFRMAMIRHDHRTINQYVRGCKFPWLNPEKK
jgi:hypothetical protein